MKNIRIIAVLIAVGAIATVASVQSGVSETDTAAFERIDPVSSQRAAGQFPASARPDRVLASWQADPATSLSVTWRSVPLDGSANAEIARATASPEFASSARTDAAQTEVLETPEGTVQFHSVTFSGLEPETLYAYRVGGGEVWSEWHQFRTASEEPKPFSFIYLGDAQNDILSLWSRAIRGAYAEAPDARFIVHAGDLVNRANRDSEWGEWFAAGAWIQASVPSIPAPGNHEYERGDDEVRRLSHYWRPQFTLPTHGPAGLDETVYYIDYQGVRIVALNSNERLEEQAEWLDDVLADNPNAWTVVTFHHPVFSVARGRDNPELRRLWKPLFDRYGVDLAMQGHDHTYGRGQNVGEGLTAQDQRTGTVYAVSVSGPKMYSVADGTEWMDRRAEDTQLYQVIHVAGDTLRYEARTVTGGLYDAFDLVRRPESGNELIERGPDTRERRAPSDR